MILLVLIIGLVLGSFLNVVIHRLPNKQSLVRPASHCPQCKERIHFYDNIPLLSYLILRGRCRQCGSSVPLRYPLVEALTGVCLVSLFIIYGLSVQFITYSVLTLFLIPISFIDWDRKLILNRLTIPGFILGILLILGLQVESWKSMALGAVCGGGVVWLIGFAGQLLFRKESLGMGDVKLLVMIGVYVGFPNVLVCLFYGILAAALFIFSGLALKKIRLGDLIPFGPFIALGSFVHLLIGDMIVRWYIGLF